MELAYDHMRPELAAASWGYPEPLAFTAATSHALKQASDWLITLKALPKYMEQIVTQQEMKGQCPEDETDKLMWTSHARCTSHHIKKEKANSPTWLVGGNIHLQDDQQIRRWDNAKENAGNLWCQSQTTSHLHHWVQIYLGGGAEKRAQKCKVAIKKVNNLPQASKSSPCRLKEKSARWVMGNSFKRGCPSLTSSHPFPHTWHLIPSSSYHIYSSSIYKIYSTSLQDIVLVQVASKWDSNITSAL